MVENTAVDIAISNNIGAVAVLGVVVIDVEGHFPGTDQLAKTIHDSRRRLTVEILAYALAGQVAIALFGVGVDIGHALHQRSAGDSDVLIALIDCARHRIVVDRESSVVPEVRASYQRCRIGLPGRIGTRKQLDVTVSAQVRTTLNINRMLGVDPSQTVAFSRASQAVCLSVGTRIDIRHSGAGQRHGTYAVDISPAADHDRRISLLDIHTRLRAGYGNRATGVQLDLIPGIKIILRQNHQRARITPITIYPQICIVTNQRFGGEAHGSNALGRRQIHHATGPGGHVVITVFGLDQFTQG